jgi:glucan 1,3-beta-glucosidase
VKKSCLSPSIRCLNILIVIVKSITFDSVQHGIWMESTVVGGSIHLLDSTMNGVVQNGIVIDSTVGTTQQEQLLLTIDNLVVDSATLVVYDVNAVTYLATSGAQTVQSWSIGKVYDAKNPAGTWVNGAALDTLHPTTGNLMGGPNGGFFERSKNQYDTFSSGSVLPATLLAVGTDRVPLPFRQ